MQTLCRTISDAFTQQFAVFKVVYFAFVTFSVSLSLYSKARDTRANNVGRQYRPSTLTRVSRRYVNWRSDRRICRYFTFDVV